MIGKIKKTLAILLILLFAAVCGACKGGDSEKSPQPSGTQTEHPASPDNNGNGDKNGESDGDASGNDDEKDGSDGEKDGTIIVLPPEKF